MDTEVAESKSTITTWLFNPFHYVAGGQALAIGLTITLAACVNGSISHSHFDGVFDLHTGAPAPLWAYPVEGLIDWFILSLFVWVGGLSLSKSRIRAIDVFGTQALARTPTLAMAAVVLLPGFQQQLARLLAMDQSVVPLDLAQFIFVAIFILAMIVWMVILMYRAFAVSCNVKGWKAIVVFIVAAFLAEAASKVLVTLFLKRVLG